MKYFVVIFLALTSQSYAGTNGSSEEEDRINISNQKEWNDIVKAMTIKSQWRSSASSLPGANPYKIKVTHRIQTSNVLRDMENIKEKLYKIAGEKLAKCVSPVRQELDMRCVGRVTGQIMQLIFAVENSRRYESYTGDKRRIESANLNI